MRANVGGVDRLVRVVIGVVLLSLVRYGPQTAWGYVGLLPLATGAFGWCPLYALLRISTAPKAPAEPAA